MGRTLRRRQAIARSTIELETRRVGAETRIVALAYLIWPVALYDRIARRPNASSWYQFHVRQALWFGNIAALVALVAFMWPFAASLVVGNVTATILLYVVAMLLDVAFFVLWFILAIRYSQRAGRGELFDVPWLARVTGNRSKTA